MLTCLSFVFLNLMQFTIVKYIQNNINSHNRQVYQMNRRKSSLINERALTDYLMQKNREKYQMVKKLKELNKNKSTNFKKAELIKYMAIEKIRPSTDKLPANKRLNFLSTKKRDGKELNFKSFLTNNYNDHRSFIYDSSSSQFASNYDRTLKERINRLVKYNSSSSSESDSDEEENWYLSIKQDYEIKDLIHQIDFVSRCVFLAAFAAFNLIYWPYMIINSSK